LSEPKIYALASLRNVMTTEIMLVVIAKYPNVYAITYNNLPSFCYKINVGLLAVFQTFPTKYNVDEFETPPRGVQDSDAASCLVILDICLDTC